MATAASEPEQLVTAGLQICLQFDRVGIRVVMLRLCSITLVMGNYEAEFFSLVLTNISKMT